MYTKGKEALMYGRNSYGLGQKIGLLGISKYDTTYNNFWIQRNFTHIISYYLQCNAES